MFENHSQDTRYTGPLNVAQTVSATYGTGGNNQPFVVENFHKAYGICGKYSNSMLSDNPNSGFYEANTSRTIDTSNQSPCKNQDLQIKVKPQFSEFTNNSQDKKWHDKKAASNLKKEAA